MSAEDERAAEYAEALRKSPNGPWLTLPGPVSIAPSLAAAVMAVADAEQEALRAEVERLRSERQHAIDVANRTYTQAVDAERALAVERARVARVEALAEWFERQENWRAWNVHGQIRRALADPDAQNGSGRPVAPAPSTDTSEGSQGRTEAHSTPNEANRGRRTKETT